MFTFLYAASFVYGLSVTSLPFVVQGILRGATTLPLLVGVILSAHVWRATPTLDRMFLALTTLSAILFVCLALTIQRQLLFAALFLVALPSAAHQPWLMYQTKHRGDVEGVLAAVMFLNNGFWFVYVLALQQWLLAGIISLFFGVTVAMLVLWIHYPARQSR